MAPTREVASEEAERLKALDALSGGPRRMGEACLLTPLNLNSPWLCAPCTACQ